MVPHISQDNHFDQMALVTYQGLTPCTKLRSFAVTLDHITLPHYIFLENKSRALKVYHDKVIMYYLNKCYIHCFKNMLKETTV